MNKKLHLGIGHYGIGFQDGVNTVISRNVRALHEIDPHLKITLFGKLSPDYRDFLEPIPGVLEYLNIDEFYPESELRRRVEKSIADQQVHDYVWQGTNLAEILDARLADMDVILTENLGIEIMAQRGSPVTAVARGVVQTITWQRGRGNIVIISHDRGFYTVYTHLSEIHVELSEPVQSGQVIGTVGNSGTPSSVSSNTVEVHLHLELWVGENYVGQFLRPIEAREWLERIIR